MTDLPRPYLVAYDIAAPRRLHRVRRFLIGHAIPVQYSVFAAGLTRRQLDTVLAGLGRLIGPKTDDVRIYPLPAAPMIDCLGHGALPQGIFACWGGFPMHGSMENPSTERV